MTEQDVAKAITEPTKASNSKSISVRRRCWKCTGLNCLILSLCLFSIFTDFMSTDSVLLELLEIWDDEFWNGEANSDDERSDSAQLPRSTGFDNEQPMVGGFDYEQPMVRTIYTLPDPQIYADQFLITIVLSARDNFTPRRAIRESWGKGHSIYFVIGGPQNSTDTPTNQTSLEEEQRQHQDILDAIHPDAYQSLPHKVKFSYRWILDHLPETQWIIKADDDMMVNVEAIKNQFLNKLSPNVPMVVGCVKDQLPVHRVGKWAERKYAQNKYPFFPLGSCGHVLSHSAARYIANKENLTYYQGEDTSVGIWLDESDMQVTWVRSAYFTNAGQCLDKPWLIRGHYIAPSEMLSCYDKKDQWLVNKVRMNALSINGIRHLLL